MVFVQSKAMEEALKAPTLECTACIHFSVCKYQELAQTGYFRRDTLLRKDETAEERSINILDFAKICQSYLKASSVITQ